MIFAGFKSGFATAIEISAFAALYALIVGSVLFRELSFKTTAAAVRPILGYLGLLFVRLVVIALVPAISTALPHALGY